MKQLIFTVLVLLVPSLAFMACEERGREGAQTTDSASSMSNAELENSIKSRLDGDDQLKVANLKVNADRNRKVATLSGTVESESLRSRAIDLAKSAQPDVSIQDHIEITPTEVSRKDYTVPEETYAQDGEKLAA
jgi:osmotically-inducible protein OsmY